MGSSTLRGPRAAAGGGLPARLLGKPSGAVFTGGARAPWPPQLRRRGCGTRFGTEPPKRCAPHALSRVCRAQRGPGGESRPTGVGCVPRAVPTRWTPPVPVRPHTRSHTRLSVGIAARVLSHARKSNERGSCERRECLLAAVRHAYPRYPCASRFSHRVAHAVVVGGHRRLASRCACVAMHARVR